MNELERLFHQAIVKSYEDALKIRYRATRFMQMVEEYGSIETAHMILQDTTTNDGLTTLWKKNRLDLSLEALILKPEFSSLFTADERQTARAKLTNMDYTAPWDIGI